MINLKRLKKQRSSTSEDLSIVTGGRPAIHLKRGGTGTAIKNWKRVSKENVKLRRELEIARSIAYSLKSPALGGTLFTSYTRTNVSSASSLPHPQPEEWARPRPDENGHWTIKCLPHLVTAADTKKAVYEAQQRKKGILKPSNTLPTPITSTNVGSHGHVQQSLQYRSKFGNAGKAKMASTVFNQSARRYPSASKASSWKITSSMTMTRETASKVQQEVAAAMNSSGSFIGSSSNSCNFPVERDPQEHFGMPSVMTPGYFIPSLVNDVMPPQFPFYPMSNASTPSSRGVFQSEWVDRSKCTGQGQVLSKQYSVEQLMDMVCGFATPDSIMANNLFEPSPSPSHSAIPFAATVAPAAPALMNQLNTSACSEYSHHSTSNLPSFNVFEPNTVETQSSSFTVYEDEKEEEENDDGEVSIYFKNPKPKKKSVCFLTDTQDNIRVTRHLFDPFSQQPSQESLPPSGSGSSANVFGEVFLF